MYLIGVYNLLMSPFTSLTASPDPANTDENVGHKQKREKEFDL